MFWFWRKRNWGWLQVNLTLVIFENFFFIYTLKTFLFRLWKLSAAQPAWTGERVKAQVVVVEEDMLGTFARLFAKCLFNICGKDFYIRFLPISPCSCSDLLFSPSNQILQGAGLSKRMQKWRKVYWTKQVFFVDMAMVSDNDVDRTMVVDMTMVWENVWQCCGYGLSVVKVFLFFSGVLVFMATRAAIVR